MPKKTWKALRIEFKAEAAEWVESALWDLGMLGSVTESEEGETVTQTGYFAPKAKLPALIDRLRTVPGIGRIEPHQVPDEDWLKKWKESYTAFAVGQRFIVAPTWESVPAAPDRLILRMDPGMAFGSGTHESTKLCLLAIEKYYQPGKTLLDVGTGSGILALAAAKMVANLPPAQRRAGKEVITALDEDPLAIQVARKNFRTNRVSPYIATVVGALGNVRLKKHDFIVANTTAKDLIAQRDALIKALKRTGWLVLSGILSTQDEEVMAAFSQAGPWMQVDKLHLNEWFAVALRR